MTFLPVFITLQGSLCVSPNLLAMSSPTALDLRLRPYCTADYRDSLRANCPELLGVNNCGEDRKHQWNALISFSVCVVCGAGSR